ncbi:MAG: hypothetical protein ACXWVT_14300, partial [Burkholderiaceae bacterium]
MSGMQFDDAIAFAQSHEIPWPRDPAADPARWGVHHDDPPPFNRLRGPVHPRGGVSGVIRVRGEEVAAWGEPDRADQTFSVAKTYLALLAGIATFARASRSRRARERSAAGHRLRFSAQPRDHMGAPSH